MFGRQIGVDTKGMSGVGQAQRGVADKLDFHCRVEILMDRLNVASIALWTLRRDWRWRRIVNGSLDADDAAIRVHKEQEIVAGATTGIGEGVTTLLFEIRGFVLRPFDRPVV